MTNVVPDIDDDEFADELVVAFTLRKPKLLEFVLPKVEFIPPSGVAAYEDWLKTRMVPTPVVDDNGDPVLDEDGTPKTEAREAITDREVWLKQIEVALLALAKEHQVITPAKARQVIARLEAAPLGQLRWIYQTWSQKSELTVGESDGSPDSSQESSGEPSAPISSPVESSPAA